MSAQRLWVTTLLALCGPIASAIAEDLFLLRSGANEIVLLDRASIARRGARAQAWVVERRETPGRAASETRSLYVFDCAARTLGVVERRGDSQAAASAPVTAPARSAMERTLLAYACGR